MIGCKTLRPLAVLATIAFLFAGQVFGAPIATIGILGFRPAAEDHKRWQPLIDHLNARIPGYEFRALVLGYGALESAIANRSVDFVLTNPGHYVLMTQRNGMSSPLATLVPIEHGRALSVFGGVIFTKADRNDIRQLDDLRHRTVAATSKGSLGGYQAQAMALLGLGIRIQENARLIETDMPHDRVVDVVLNGRADAGFVRTGVLEAMAREGKLDISQIKVVDHRNVAGFPYLLSTDLYPEWPIAAMPSVDHDLAREVASVLLGLPHGGTLARRMDIHGFNVPEDYGTVRDVLAALRLPPFDTAPIFTFADIWHKYRTELGVGLVLFGIILVLGAWLLLLNRRIDNRAHEWEGLLTALGDGVFGIGPDGRCTFINPMAAAMLGYTRSEVLNQDVHTLFHRCREDGSPYPKGSCPVLNTLTDGQMRHAEDYFIAKDGTPLPVAITATPVRIGKQGQGIVVVFRDVSIHRRRESKLLEEATTDELTGLPNRRHFIAEMERRRSEIADAEEGHVAIMMLDLDRFKIINDTCGHAAGDAVLQHLAGLTREVLRKGDLVGRLGGEEFAVILGGASKREALRLAQRLRQRIEESRVQTASGELRYTASIGVTVMVESDADAHAALARSDRALYRAKELGRNRVEWEPAPNHRTPTSRAEAPTNGSGAQVSRKTTGEAIH